MERSGHTSQTEALEELSQFTRENGGMLNLDEVMSSRGTVDGSTIRAGIEYGSDLQQLPLYTEGLPSGAQNLSAAFRFRSLLLEPEATEYMPKRFNLPPNEIGATVLMGSVQYHGSDGENVGHRRVSYCFQQGVAQLLDAHFAYFDTIPSRVLFSANDSILRGALARKFVRQANNVDVENALIHRAIDTYPQLSFFSAHLPLTRRTFPDAVRLHIK